MTLRNAFANLALDATVTDVKTSVNAVHTSADQIKTSVDTVNTSVNTSAGQVKISVDAVHTTAGQIKTSVDSTKGAVDTATAAVNYVAARVDAASTGIISSVDQIPATVAIVAGKTDLVKTSVDQVKTSVDQVKTSVDAVNTTLTGGDININVNTNITSKFRDAFQTFVNGVNWNLTQATGDIVQLDGNAVSASYLVVSKDPLRTGTTTILEATDLFDAPVELAVGLHMSQRIAGHEVSMELVSDETPLPTVSDIAIQSISQTTTTLTVYTSTPHGLSAGQRIGIRDVTDSRFNYPQVVVATVPHSQAITITGGPLGTITSLTATGPNNSGYIYVRSTMGGARNGISEIFEGISATGASIYTRAASGDALPSGTNSASHVTTVGSTSSQVPISAANVYSFRSTTEYRMNLQIDRATLNDVSVDNTGATSTRAIRTEIVPDVSKKYKLRFRVVSTPSTVIPNAQIVSVSKSGTTTATITTDVAHGLTTGDYVVTYGARDATNFPVTGSATGVNAVLSPTQFQIVWGTAATATSYGGFVARSNGNQGVGGLNGSILQTIERVTSPDVLQVTLNAAGAGLSIGDYVNLVGVRDNTTGASLGLDGVYRVTDTFASTYRFEPIGNTTLPASLAVTNCGGAIIKRTDLRLSFARVMDYVRERVELLHRSDSAGAVGVNVTNTPAVTVSSGTVTPISTNAYALQSSTNLAASATFTQTAQNIAASSTSSTVYAAQLVVGVSHTAGLVPGQLYLDVGTETSSTSPTTWYQAAVVPIPSNANWQQFVFPLSTRYYRLRFVNGSTAQTNFRLSTSLTYNGGGISNDYSAPKNLQFALSTTALAANGVFTGATMDFGDTMNIYQTMTALVYADQASATNGFKIQISRDGTTWRDAAIATVALNTLTTITTHLSYRYARVVYTNGATLQGSFALDAHVDAG